MKEERSGQGLRLISTVIIDFFVAESRAFPKNRLLLGIIARLTRINDSNRLFLLASSGVFNYTCLYLKETL